MVALPCFFDKTGARERLSEESLVQEEDEGDEEGRWSHQRAGRAKHPAEAELKKDLKS